MATVSSPQHKFVDLYTQVCLRHHCRRKKSLLWNGTNTHTQTHTHTPTLCCLPMHSQKWAERGF